MKYLCKYVKDAHNIVHPYIISYVYTLKRVQYNYIRRGSMYVLPNDE